MLQGCHAFFYVQSCSNCAEADSLTSELRMRLSSMERLQGRVSRDLELLTEVLRLGAVHLPNADLLVVLELIRKLAPDWSKLFAVPTPRCIELDKVHLSIIYLEVKKAHETLHLSRKIHSMGGKW